MKKILSTAALIFLTAAPAFAENIAKCDVAVEATLTHEDETEIEGAKMMTYMPATDFMISIYDEQPGHMTEIDGQPIVTVLCERKTIIPSLRDFTILETGLPLALAQDFDSAESGIMILYFKDGKFIADHDGPALSEKEEAQLKDRLDIFNLQMELKAAP